MKYCEEYAALLDAFVDDELSAEDAMRVREHLTSCNGCAAYVSDILALRAAFDDLDPVEAPAGLADGVCAAIRANAAPRKRNTRWIKTAVSLAACAAIVFAASKIVPLNGNIAPKQASSDVESYAEGERCAPPADVSEPQVPVGFSDNSKVSGSEVEENESSSSNDRTLGTAQYSGGLNSAGTSNQTPQNTLIAVPPPHASSGTAKDSGSLFGVSGIDGSSLDGQDRVLDTIQTDERSFKKRLSNLDEITETTYFPDSTFKTTEHVDNGSSIAWYGKLTDTAKLEQSFLFLSFADGSVSQLPLPLSSAEVTAEPDSIWFDGNDLIYEVSFIDDLPNDATQNAGDFIHLKGTYRYTVDLDTKTVSLIIK